MHNQQNQLPYTPFLFLSHLRLELLLLGMEPRLAIGSGTGSRTEESTAGPADCCWSGCWVFICYGWNLNICILNCSYGFIWTRPIYR
jgi:hypothetical protein